MEQGFHTTACWYCALVEPRFRDAECPKCGSVPRLVAAQMLAPESAQASAESMARAFRVQQRGPESLQRDRLVSLLEFLHAHGAPAVAGAAAAGVTLDDLRALHSRLFADDGTRG